MKLPTGFSLTGVHASPAPPARLVCDRSTPHRRAAACRLPPVLLDVRVDRRRSRSAHGYAEALGCARAQATSGQCLLLSRPEMRHCETLDKRLPYFLIGLHTYLPTSRAQTSCPWREYKYKLSISLSLS